jgi:hypothetical protein
MNGLNMEFVPEKLKFHRPAVGIPGEEMINPIIRIVPRRRFGDVLQATVHSVDRLTVAVDEGDHTLGIGGFALAQAEEQIAEFEDVTSSLIQPELASDLFTVELRSFSKLRGPKKDDSPVHGI